MTLKRPRPCLRYQIRCLDMLHPVSTERDYYKCLFFAGVVEIDDDDDEEDDDDDQVTFFKFTLSMLELVNAKFLEYLLCSKFDSSI